MKLAEAEGLEGRRAVDGQQVRGGSMEISDPGGADGLKELSKLNVQWSLWTSQGKAAQEPERGVEVSQSTQRPEAELRAPHTQEEMAPGSPTL